MDAKAIFSPKRPGLRTYGCRTKNQNRPRGVLIQKNVPENTSKFSLSDDSDDVEQVKGKRKVTKRTSSVKTKQKQPRKTNRGRPPKKQPDISTSVGQRKEASQSVPEMKSTPKHGLEQGSQVWVKTKIRGSDSEEDSIELPRRDKDMSWQEKISFLMPKMTHKNQQPNRKISGSKPGCPVPGFSVLNLSPEEVVDEDNDSSDELDNIETSQGTSKGQTRSDLLASRLTLHSPTQPTLQESECLDQKPENKKGHVLSPIDTSEEFTYTYEWVTDTGSGPGSRQSSKAKEQGFTSQTTTSSSKGPSTLARQNFKRKSTSTPQTNSDAYTYDWVTDSGTGQTGTATSYSSRLTTGQIGLANSHSITKTAGQIKLNNYPSNLDQHMNSDTCDNNPVRTDTKHRDKDSGSHGYLNSTKKPGALSIFQAKFPEDFSAVTSSPSQEKGVQQNKALPITGGHNRQMRQLNSTRKKDGLDIDMINLPDMSVIEKMCPVGMQPSCIDESKTIKSADEVPFRLSSTRKNGGYDIDKANFSLDVSEIKKLPDRPSNIQVLQEKTPKARQTKPKAVTPVKSASVTTKNKRRLLPKSSTVLFVSDYTRDLMNPTPSLSAIRCSQNTVHKSEYIDPDKDGVVKKAKTDSGEKHLYLDIGPDSIWKEKNSVNSGKILTSTPVASTQTQFQRPEVNLTCVPRQCFDDELEFNESIEVNSEEIIPEDFTEEDIDNQNLGQKLGEHQQPESNSPSSKIDSHRKPAGSDLQTSKTNYRGKLSVKPITESSKVSKITECCLMKPSFVFPRRKFVSYMKISQEVFKNYHGISEDILLTHNFKRR